MPANDDLDALLETALARAGEPLTAAAALKALPVGRKPTQKEVLTRLDELVAAGRIHLWPGRAKKFSSVNPRTFAREQVLGALSSGPLTEAEIRRRVAGSASSLVKAALVELVGDATVIKHPKLGRRQPFGLGPPDAADYLPAEIDIALKRLMKLGFKQAELQSALRRYVGGSADEGVSAVDGGREILAGIARLNSQASRGALVYMAELRAALQKQFPDKGSFDRAILELARQGKVQLQSHAWPGRLSASEKETLVPNARGGYFDAIGLRLE